MDKLIHTTAACLVLCAALALPARATLVPIEDALETVALDVRLRDDLTGTVTGKSCDTCESKRFAVTPQTQAIHNKVRVNLRQILEQRGKPATIIYNIRSRDATKIIWWD